MMQKSMSLILEGLNKSRIGEGSDKTVVSDLHKFLNKKYKGMALDDLSKDNKGRILIEISDGDWKHDLLVIKNLVANFLNDNGYDFELEVVDKSNGDDDSFTGILRYTLKTNEDVKSDTDKAEKEFIKSANDKVPALEIVKEATDKISKLIIFKCDNVKYGACLYDEKTYKKVKSMWKGFKEIESEDVHLAYQNPVSNAIEDWLKVMNVDLNGWRPNEDGINIIGMNGNKTFGFTVDEDSDVDVSKIDKKLKALIKEMRQYK